MFYDYLIVGAGFAGCVMAERIASQLEKKVLIVEKRHHIGGNAFDEFDENGIFVHRYGPHLFHTNSMEVFDYLSHFTEWRFYENKVMAKYRDELYPIPINRITINKLYNKKFVTDEDIYRFYNSVKENRFPVLNSEDIIVNQVGYDLFEKFFKNYTKKQWGVEPKELAPSVCGRIPVRMNDDCRYFTDKYQFMPKNGYIKMFDRMIDNKNIEVILNTDYKTIMDDINYGKLIYTGPIDYFFDYKYGKLPYRSIRFEFENIRARKYQDYALINFVDIDIPFTRIIEHKYLSGQIADTTTISKEYPQFDGEPFYPIPNDANRLLYKKYEMEARKLSNVIFCGRLAEYQYYNMDQVVANTLKKFDKIAHG